MQTQEITARAYTEFDKLLKRAQKMPTIDVAVVQPNSEDSLLGAIESYKAGLINPIFVGASAAIKEAAKKHDFDLSKFEIIDASDDKEAATKSAALATQGKVSALMKGNLHTNDIMSAVMKRDAGLRIEGQNVSHGFVLDVPAYHKLLMVADAAINIAPDLIAKAKIMRNSINLAHAIGIEKPKVAVLSAVEMPYDKIPSSIEADELTKIAKEEFKDAVVYGPLAFDNAISAAAAKIKHISSSVCGDPDILLVPQIETGNVLFKALVYLAYAKVAGLVVGAKIPIILTSRADSVEARVVSSALAVLSVNYHNNK